MQPPFKHLAVKKENNMDTIRTQINRYPLLTASCALIIAFVMLLVIPLGSTPFEKLAQEIPLALFTVLLLLAIRGPALIRFKTDGLAFTFKKSIPYLALGIVAVVVILIGLFSPDMVVQPGWGISLFWAAIFYVLLGIFEEGLFRGVILHALLARMGKTRKGLIGAVALGAFVFGFVHVVLSWFYVGVDLSAMGILQALSKTVNAGMVGFFFGAMYLKTRNIWGVALVHGLYDFLLMAGSIIFFGTNSVLYVSSDPAQAMTNLLVNAVFVVVYSPLIVTAIRQLRTIELPELGFFKGDWD